MTQEEIVAMAVAAVAEELDTEVQRVRVISFKEIEEVREET